MPIHTGSGRTQFDLATATRKRAEIIAQANRFRALAWVALRDGAPMSALRAANARGAARNLLRHAKRSDAVNRLALQTV